MSTSSSNASSPTTQAAVTPPLFQSLVVEVFENQRWFPVAGWGTSVGLQDPANFSPVLQRDSVFGCVARSDSYKLFHEAFLETNRGTMHSFPHANPPVTVGDGFTIVREEKEDLYTHVALAPLEVELPAGYDWAGYWEVHTKHPRGTDEHGWRYAENFTHPDGSGRPAHFKKTYTPTSLVRRRVWCRLARLGAADVHVRLPYKLNEEEEARHLYLRIKSGEMHKAEQLKHEKRLALERGEDWDTTRDLKLSEELYAFVQAQRQQLQSEQNSTFQSSNNSFANPFFHGDAVQGDEGIARGPQRRSREPSAPHTPHSDAGGSDADGEPAIELSDSDDFTQRIASEEKHIRDLFGGKEDSMVTFSQSHSHQRADGVQAPGSQVNRFVADTPEPQDGAPSPINSNASPSGEGGDDFERIFNQFMPKDAAPAEE